MLLRISLTAIYAKARGIYLISNWSGATIYRVRAAGVLKNEYCEFLGFAAKREHIESTRLTYRQKQKNGHLLKCPLAFIVLPYGSRPKKIRSKSLDR